MDSVTEWFDAVNQAVRNTVVTDSDGRTLDLDAGIGRLRGMMRPVTTYLIGNGGSLAVAAHLATDFNLAGLPSAALTDAVALTSHANDFGVAAMFLEQMHMLRMRAADVLIALSCSGESSNIVDAAKYADGVDMRVVTFTGFQPGNLLRQLGSLNIYVPSDQYGVVQLAHEAILHAACDFEKTWRKGASLRGILQ